MKAKEPVEGDFEKALRNMLQSLMNGERCETILLHWDVDRGTDWFTSTRKNPRVRTDP